MKFSPSSSLNCWFSRLLLWLCFSHVRGHPLRCSGHSCFTTLSYRTDISVTIFLLQLELFRLPGIMRDTHFTWKFWILRDGILNCFYWLALLWQQRWPGLPAPTGWHWEASRDTSAQGEVWELHSSSPRDVHPHRQQQGWSFYSWHWPRLLFSDALTSGCLADLGGRLPQG